MQTLSAARGKQKTFSLTKFLLLCGAIAGFLFLLLLLFQDYTRPGFDQRLDMLSLLSLGDWGWVQITNFVLAGVLNLFYATGLWRRLHPGRAGTWGTILIGIYGLGLIAAGVFLTDPSNGFPAGIPATSGPSWHGAIHALSALLIFVSLAIALLVFVRYFFARKELGWAGYCLASAVLQLLSFFVSFTEPMFTARLLRLGVLIGWTAASVIAIRLFCTSDTLQDVDTSDKSGQYEGE